MGAGSDSAGSTSGFPGWGGLLGAVAAIISILVGIKVLTGFNILDTFTRPAPSAPSPLYSEPRFNKVAGHFVGKCGSVGCAVAATFRNDGAAGAGVAHFSISTPGDSDHGGTGNKILAECTAAIPWTRNGSYVDASCSASSTLLSAYSGQLILLAFAD
jgi:hypothetical protein